jgi:hypothetical protein
MHKVSSAERLNLPGGQARHSLLYVALHVWANSVPIGQVVVQSKHVVEGTLENLPFGHAAHTMSEVEVHPFVTYCPAGHTVRQDVHEPRPGVAAYLPLSQAVHVAVLVPALAKPGRHAVQPLFVVLSTPVVHRLSLCWPAGHVGAVHDWQSAPCPPRENQPVTQLMQPLFLVRSPLAQARSFSKPAEQVGMVQAWQKPTPLVENLPTWHCLHPLSLVLSTLSVQRWSLS